MIFSHYLALISQLQSNLGTDYTKFSFLINHFLNNSVSVNRKDSFLELRTMMIKDLA
jgi:hypothetical protein